MYKKITHTIVEEHFDHPVANQIKKSIDKSRIPTNEVFDESDFRYELTEFFKNYVEKIIEIADASTGTQEQLTSALESSLVNIDLINNVLKKFYVTEYAERIGLAFRQLPVSLVGLIHQLNLGVDTQYSVDRLVNQFANEIASESNAINSLWDYRTLYTILTDIANNLFVKVKARIKNDTSHDRTSTSIIRSKFAEYEKLFIDGIISKNPERFKNKVTITQVTSRDDIM